MGLCAGGKLRTVGVHGEEGTFGYMFWCPGCKSPHHVTVKESTHHKRPVWGFNGNEEKPTFTPSLLCRSPRHVPPVTPENLEEYKRNPWEQTRVEHVCHTFITDGKIQFLTDCTHELAGQTVDIPTWPADSNWD